MSSIPLLPGAITLEVDDAGTEDAHKRAESLGKLRKSITRGKGNVTGYMGEAAVVQWLRSCGVTVERDDTHHYDLMCNGLKVEVKTKKTGVTPEPFHMCSVCTRTRCQSCDVYVFARWIKETRTVHILGWWEADRLTHPPFRFHKEGEPDADTGFDFKADCYNVQACFLKTTQSLLEKLGAGAGCGGGGDETMDT